jgi:hypothetical protein
MDKKNILQESPSMTAYEALVRRAIPRPFRSARLIKLCDIPAGLEGTNSDNGGPSGTPSPTALFCAELRAGTRFGNVAIIHTSGITLRRPAQEHEL